MAGAQCGTIHHHQTGQLLDLLDDPLQHPAQAVLAHLVAEVHEADGVADPVRVEEGVLLLVAQHLDRRLAQHREVQPGALGRGVGEHELVGERGLAAPRLAGDQVEGVLRYPPAQHRVEAGHAGGELMDRHTLLRHSPVSVDVGGAAPGAALGQTFHTGRRPSSSPSRFRAPPAGRRSDAAAPLPRVAPLQRFTQTPRAKGRIKLKRHPEDGNSRFASSRLADRAATPPADQHLQSRRAAGTPPTARKEAPDRGPTASSRTRRRRARRARERWINALLLKAWERWTAVGLLEQARPWMPRFRASCVDGLGCADEGIVYASGVACRVTFIPTLRADQNAIASGRNRNDGLASPPGTVSASAPKGGLPRVRGSDDSHEEWSGARSRSRGENAMPADRSTTRPLRPGVRALPSGSW